jgi:Tol biopolymer transport system component
MAVHYPDTIVWSPDSANVAFMAMTRAGQTSALPTPTQAENQTDTATNSESNANSDANLNANMENTNPVATQTPIIEQPKAVLTFRTEQIYISTADGGDLKPVTQNEGLIYFYFVWSPDGSALAALASTFQEWRFLQYQAESRGEAFAPAGRPRLVEKNGRERRLDDNLTIVHPAWSPDSAKVAVAFDKQVRIYDAIGDAPTQAAIPLRNQLLISSKAYDEELQRKEQAGTANTNAAAPADANTQSNNAVNQQVGTLPDENTLVSFNPVIDLKWTEDKMLYLQTGYIKLMKNEADSARSYLRWHRLIFSPQPVALGG